MVGPRPVIEQSFQAGYIRDGEEWMEMLKRRNEASHTYQEEVAEQISSDIKEEFIDLFNDFLKRLEDEKRS